jgi:thiamine-phosphate pyrophosphorylase
MDFRNLLYPILDFDFCNAHNIPFHTLISAWELYPRAISFFQLRAKSLSTSDYKNLYLSAKNKSSLPIIINDHLDIALECNAFGIHIGKEDYENLNKSLKQELQDSSMLKGTSSHSQNDIECLEDFWDYTGIGPLFPTSSKISSYPPIGIENLLCLTKISKIPLVPIGGINISHIYELTKIPNVVPASISLFSNIELFPKIVSIWHKNRA